MPRSRALLLAALTAVFLTSAPPAHAAITLTRTDEAVVVVGDGGAQRIQIADGSTTGGDNYAFRFYSDDNEPIDLGDSGCISDDGAPIETIFCGTGAFNQAAFVLGGGNDSLGWYGDRSFDTLGALGVDFGAGNDTNESGIAGISTELAGGEGDDDLAGHDGPTSIVEGGPGADQIVGGDNLTGEMLHGGDGDDNISGVNGDDQIFGDAGNDSLVGGSGGDTIDGGPGQDTVEGDGVPGSISGNDTLVLGDGERDVGVCGFGADTVTGDSFDLLPAQDCESVSLTGGGPPAGPPPGGGGVPTGGSAKVVLAKPGKLSARARRLAVKVTCPSSASGSCSGRVSFTLRFTERGKQRKVSAGSVGFVLAPGASETVSRKLSKKLVRRLRKAKRRKLTVRATSRDGAGRRFTSLRTATLTLKR